MVKVTRISKEQLFNEFGTNTSYQFTDNQTKSIRTSRQQLTNGFGRNTPWHITGYRSNSEDVRHKSMNNNYFTYTTMQHHPSIHQAPSFKYNNSVGQIDSMRSSSILRNSRAVNLSSIRSVKTFEKKKQGRQYRCSITPKMICCCLTTLFILGAIAAVITILVLQLTKTSTTTTITTTTIATTTTGSTTISTTVSTTIGTTTTSMIFTSASKINWLINGDGETGPCEPGGNVTHPTGWNYNGTITQIYYNNTLPGLLYTDPGPNNRGHCFFCGQDSSVTTMWQTVNMTESINASLIDNQLIWFNFSAWIGGYTTQNDNAQVSLTFLDQANQKVGNTTTLGPILAVDRNGITSLLFQQAGGLVPIGARYFRVLVTIILTNGQFSDGDIDNIAVLFNQ